MNVRQRTLGLLLASWIALLSASGAQAVIVTGAFSGIAVNVSGYDHLPNGGNGSPLSGTFSFDSEGEQSGPDGIFASPMEFTMTLDLLGRQFVYGPGGVSIFTVENNAAGQVVALNSHTAYRRGGLLLAGAAGAFVDGFDLSSFRAAPVDAARSSIWFTTGRWSDWSAEGVLTGVTIDPLPVTPAIPEPASVLVMLIGLFGLLWRLRPAPRSIVGPCALA